MDRKFATRLAVLLFLCTCAPPGECNAQDLAPRAYLITPTSSNAVGLVYSFLDGNIEFSGALPITDAKARIHVPTVSYYRAFGFFGRSANFTAYSPYGIGNFRGTVLGAETRAYRSGLLAPVFRISVNLIGGPAMNVKDFMQWKQKRILGASFRVVPAAGQYDPTKLVNLGTNRWAFKPELGYSQRLGHWMLDAYGGGWFFTANPDFFSHNAFSPDANVQKENPVASLEGHLSYDFKPRMWVSLDGNFWSGGRTSLNGVPSVGTIQRNSRIGATGSIPLTARESLKISYSVGAYIRYGGNYQNVSLAWQYSWTGNER